MVNELFFQYGIETDEYQLDENWLSAILKIHSYHVHRTIDNAAGLTKLVSIQGWQQKSRAD